jgi:hypothetical protein
VSQADRAPLLAALETFLRAEAGAWPRLAPELVSRAGADRLRDVVDATRDRLGGIDLVRDTAEGLAIGGPRGEVLVWARADTRGRLTGLWIAGTLRGRRRSPARTALIAGVLPVLPIGWGVAGCWTAGTVRGWIGALLVLAAMVVIVEGFAALAARPWWVRRPIELLVLWGLVSAVRVPSFDYATRGTGTAGDAVALAGGAVLLIAAVATLAGARRHRWHITTAEPLPVFPVTGRWYVVQGGGRLINHHTAVADQRGAIDLVGIRAGGSYRGDRHSLGSYAGYGHPVVSPCAGRVVAAVDGIEDQKPGVVRFAPPYGNHVSIDNGAEIVTVAHLRKDSVAVASGELVAAGRLLGAVGNSGNSSAPHLHLQAERAGLGLDLRFAGINGGWWRGRTVRMPAVPMSRTAGLS